jgi:hypothetical protein
MPYESGTLIAELKESLTWQRYNPVAIHNYCRNLAAARLRTD